MITASQRIARYPATGFGTPVATSTSANTKGSYVELISSTPFDVDGLVETILPAEPTAGFLGDIAIGAAGAEQDLISNIGASGMATGEGQFNVELPIRIPAGVRVAARSQCTTAAARNMWFSTQLLGSTTMPRGRQRATTYGATTADSGGTSVDGGAVANTKGAYAELSASVNALSCLVTCLGHRNNTAPAETNGVVDISIGAAGSEQVVVPDSSFYWDSGTDLLSPTYYGHSVLIPEGVRLAARLAIGTTDATDRILDVHSIGFN